MNASPLFQVFELVSAELCFEFVESISREQTQNLLKDIAAKTGVKWIKTAESFVMTGTSKQMDESRALLKQSIHQSIPLTNRVRGPYCKLRTEFFPV